MPTFEAMREGYRNMWRSMKLRPEAIPVADKVARGIIADRQKYLAIEKATWVPWFFIGVLHHRESGRDFTTYLGNGEPLNRRTRIVPKGRGPFPTFDAGAIDALKIDRLDLVRVWPIERMLYQVESFNGFGYSAHGVNSPYVWSGTYHYNDPTGVDGHPDKAGKYISDGVFSATAVDQQLGCAALIYRLCMLSPEINKRVNGSVPPAFPPDVEPVPPAPPKLSVWGALAEIFKSLFRRK